MLLFTDKLKKETSINHRILDTHLFVKTIYETTICDSICDTNETDKNKYIKYYLDLHCIVLQRINDIIVEHNNLHDIPDFYKHFDKKYNEFIKDSPLYKMDTVINYLKEITHDDKYSFLTHCYSWYLAILYGGFMIKKYILSSCDDNLMLQQTDILFDFDCDKQWIIRDIKKYLNDTIVTETDQNQFIQTVNMNYIDIKQIFDKFIL